MLTCSFPGKDNVVGMTYLKYWDSDISSPNAPHSGKIMDIRLTSNERHLVAASKDKTITLWDMMCNAFLRRLVGHEDEVRP
jgi:WD40 repeat protein